MAGAHVNDEIALTVIYTTAVLRVDAEVCRRLHDYCVQSYCVVLAVSYARQGSKYVIDMLYQLAFRVQYVLTPGISS